MLAFDLGGIRGASREGYKTVNLLPAADICENFLHLDAFCMDGSVDAFLLSHSLEHVPVVAYIPFLEKLRRKLKVGGIVEIIQTDIEALMREYFEGRLSWQTVQCATITPASRVAMNPMDEHKSIHCAASLTLDLTAVGFTKTWSEPIGPWDFCLDHDLHPEITKDDWYKPIPQLRVFGQA